MAKKQTDPKTPSLQEIIAGVNNANGDNSSNNGYFTPAQKGLSSEDVARLEVMSREQLINLIRTVSKAGWGYGGLTGAELVKNALMSKDEAYEALKLTALTLAYNAKEWREFHALASFWAEREKGKPQQSVDVTGKLSIIDIVLNIPKSALEEKTALIEHKTTL